MQLLLLLERIFEDHENLVENLLNWTRDSHNKLMFIERIEKYALFKNPQVSVPLQFNTQPHPQVAQDGISLFKNLLDSHGLHGAHTESVCCAHKRSVYACSAAAQPRERDQATVFVYEGGGSRSKL